MKLHLLFNYYPLLHPSYPWQVQTPNRNPCHDLTKTHGRRRSLYLVLIPPTENLLTHPGKSFRINERWYYQLHCTSHSLPFGSELINDLWIVCTTNHHPSHDLTQAFGERKSVCPVWICPTENLIQHPRIIIRNNKCWFYQCQITITQQHTKNISLGIEPRTTYYWWGNGTEY